MELVVFCKPWLKQLQDWAWGLNERALLQLAAPSGSGVPWRQASPSWELSPWRQGFERPWWVAILAKATAANALGVACVSLLRSVPSAGSTVKYGKGRFACYWLGSRRRNSRQYCERNRWPLRSGCTYGFIHVDFHRYMLLKQPPQGQKVPKRRLRIC